MQKNTLNTYYTPPHTTHTPPHTQHTPLPTHNTHPSPHITHTLPHTQHTPLPTDNTPPSPHITRLSHTNYTHLPHTTQIPPHTQHTHLPHTHNTNTSLTPVHFFSFNKLLQSIQLRSEDASQHIVHEVQLSMTGHVPLDTQVVDVPGYSPVLQDKVHMVIRDE